MTRQHVDHSDIKRFAEDKVNLSMEHSKKYREQADRLKKDLEDYLADHEDFSLRKILRSGSLAKRTALRSINDIDMACYITAEDPSNIVSDLERHLREAFPNFKPDQVERQKHSVKVSFRGTGLDIDVVPIHYEGDKEWYGNLMSQDDGEFLETNIPYHLDFIKTRKNKNANFAEVVRLLKTWVRKEKRENPESFKFKSFMVELILAHLCDNGQDLSDYPEALQAFFTYIISSRLKEQIFFRDFHKSASVKDFGTPIQIIDPVNFENNVAQLYTQNQAELIIKAAGEAADNLDYALFATSKAETVDCWQRIFGKDFSI